MRLSRGSKGALAGVTVLAPAKINLGLEILGKRRDGYHEIATVLQTLRLTDRIVLRPAAEPGIRLQVRPAGLDLGPAEENLVVRAGRLVPPSGAQPPGLEIELTKRIPVGAGLGGGSADAAAVLVGLSTLRRGGFNPERLEELAATLGMDVPFFVRGGTQLGTGRGECLRAAPTWPFHNVVLVYPNCAVSTALVYGSATFGLTSPGPLSSLRTRGFTRDFWSKQGPRLRNDLEPAVLKLEPVVGELLDEFRGLGSTSVHVTGSGSAVFGLAPDGRKAIAWSEHFRRKGFWARPVRPARGGCIIRQ
jgi:4-diphosphocytidyl-2-C-methyl-D-erythritol kinase